MEDLFSDLFDERKAPSKCDNCVLTKKNIIDVKKDSNFICRAGDGKDVLIIVESIEYDSYIRELKTLLKLKGIYHYTIISALQCTPINAELPNPLAPIFSNCNCITTEIQNKSYKAIITLGRAIYSVTKTADFLGWLDFCEYKFNPTYFYTGDDWKEKIRVYPMPNIGDWIRKDNFAKHFTKVQLKNVHEYLRDYNTKKLEYKPYLCNFVDDPDTFLRENMDKTELALDTETTGLDIFNNDFNVRCVTISFDGINGYYLPFEKINKRLLSTFLKGKKQYYANGKFDCKVLEKVGIKNVEVDEDVILLFHVLNTQRMFNGLKTLAWFLGIGGYDEELDYYWKTTRGMTWRNIPHSKLFNYATTDAIVTFRAVQLGRELGKVQPKIYNLYKDVLIPVIPVFKEMEQNGMEVDFDYVEKLHTELTDKKNALEKEIKDELKIENISSNEQLGKALELLGWKDHGKGVRFWVDEKGKEHNFYKVGDPQLSKWVTEGHDLAKKIKEYKVLEKLDGTFVGDEDTADLMQEDFFVESTRKEDDKGLYKYIMDDGLIHGNLNPARTDTWRSSSNDPNLQNQPKRGDEGKKFRPVYKCPDDCLICEADYDGFQLRIGAIYSGDETMKDAFINRGGDLHSRTAVTVFARDKSIEEFLKLKKEQPYKGMRDKSKNVNFGFLFGRAAMSFKGDIETSWSEEDIDAYIKENNLEIAVDKFTEQPDKLLTVAADIRSKFFEAYSNLGPWIESQHRFAEAHGYVESLHGARRHLPQLLYVGRDEDKKLLSNLYNISVNSPVQAVEAVELYKALRKIYDHIKENNLKTKLVATVHDSIVSYVAIDELEEIALLLQNSMDSDEYDVPIRSSSEFGTVWGFGTEVNLKNLDESIEKIKKEYLQVA